MLLLPVLELDWRRSTRRRQNHHDHDLSGTPIKKQDSLPEIPPPHRAEAIPGSQT